MALNVEQVRRLRPQNEIHYFLTIGSTMTEATRLIEAGAPEGTVVLAEEQTSGIGRAGRSWESRAELGIYCSILLRLSLQPSRFPIASLLMGLAVAEAIEKAANLPCDLRWPNDVLIRERKVAGILTHLVGEWVVAGVGINVNQESFGSGLRTPATSLRQESGNKEMIARETVLVELLSATERAVALLQAQGPGAIIQAFARASSYAVSRRVVIEESGGRGVTAGLDEQGFLLVTFDNGRTERITAGGVRSETDKS
jgi:BirA family transcriptional regulator, biotin operon repressor / biotin---[acetyl-CoA-carboxylase] ligase